MLKAIRKMFRKKQRISENEYPIVTDWLCQNIGCFNHFKNYNYGSIVKDIIVDGEPSWTLEQHPDTRFSIYCSQECCDEMQPLIQASKDLQEYRQNKEEFKEWKKEKQNEKNS